jgi:hypothetical protein
MRFWIVLIGLLSMPTLAAAQGQAAAKGQKELTAHVGWQFGGTQEFYSFYAYNTGDVHTNAAANFGGILTTYLASNAALELAYSYQSTNLILRPDGAPDSDLGTISCQYIHLQGVRIMPSRPGMDFLVLGGIGATVFSAEAFDPQWLFSISVGGGIKYAVGERMALRLQSRLLVPIQFHSGSFYFGSGESGVSATGTAFAQGDVSIGLTMRLGK